MYRRSEAQLHFPVTACCFGKSGRLVAVDDVTHVLYSARSVAVKSLKYAVAI